MTDSQLVAGALAAYGEGLAAYRGSLIRPTHALTVHAHALMIAAHLNMRIDFLAGEIRFEVSEGETRRKLFAPESLEQFMRAVTCAAFDIHEESALTC